MLAFLREAVRYEVVAIKDIEEEKVNVCCCPVLNVVQSAAEEGDAIRLMHLQPRPA